MKEKRMIGPYEIQKEIQIGKKEIVMGENKSAAPDERYICCSVERMAIFEQYTDAVASDNYEDIVKVFGERIAETAAEVQKEREEIEQEIGEDKELSVTDCLPIAYEDCLEGKIVVIKSDILAPEYRRATHQLMRCIGGFGAQKNARGRTCYCINLYSGEKETFYRSDILGTAKSENLPAWALQKLAE